MESGTKMDTLLDAILANPTTDFEEIALNFEANINILDWDEDKSTLTSTVEDLLSVEPQPDIQAPPLEGKNWLDWLLEDLVPETNQDNQETYNVVPQMASTSQDTAAHSQPETWSPEAIPEPFHNIVPHVTSTGPAPKWMNYPTQDDAPHSQQTSSSQYTYVLQHVPGPYYPTHTANGNPIVQRSMLHPVGAFNGEMIYRYVPEPSAYYSYAPTAPTYDTSRKRQRDYEEKPYIKKPLNAFMLFRAEQQQKIMEELNIRNSAEVNKVVGERWRMLSAEEQDVYFQQAHEVRKAHNAKYPNWSASDNFGKNVKRRKTNNTATTVPTYDNTMMMMMMMPATHQAPSYTGPVTWQAPHC